MEQESGPLATDFQRILGVWTTELLRPWTGVQILIVVGLIAAAWVAGAAIERRLEARIREIKGRPRLLRLLAILLRRTRWVVAAAALWGAVLVMREFTWPSRSYLVALAAVLVTAWVVIAILSRAIRNRFLARIVAALVWVVVALRITGTFDTAMSALDAAGVRFGENRISLLAVVKATILFGALLWGASALANLAERLLGRSADLTPRVQVLLGKLARIALVVAAGLVALNTIGIDLTALTVFSGAVGVGLGFGLQKVVSNFVSGIIILLDKSIKPGDTIALGETFGWIRSLQARFVSVVTRDGKEYLIPNEDLITSQVVNWSFSDTLIRLDVEFGVSYDSDPHEVTRLAIEAARGVDRVQESPAPVCWLTGFGESSLDFILRFWIADPQRGLTNIRGAVLLACWDAFKQAGIGIPFPHREILVRTPVDVRLESDGGARRPARGRARSRRRAAGE